MFYVGYFVGMLVGAFLPKWMGMNDLQAFLAILVGGCCLGLLEVFFRGRKARE